jgi:nitronate monooxygenase
LVVFDRFSLADLSVRLLAAPMAGGPSKPELVAAVADSGGLGFLAGGLSSAEELADAIFGARKLTSGALGVNLLVPQQLAATEAQLSSFESALKPEASRYGATVGEPGRHYDWDAKLDVICDLRPEAVSFTFGSPTREQSRRLKSVGTMVLATVTTVREAMLALSCGADALVVQGPDAGGHRATFDPFAAPPDNSLDDLVSMLAYCFDYPIVAAGGLGTPRDVRRLRDAGAAAVQLGTAFLLADEAGTNPVHRAALGDPQFKRTVLTRAFTGRYGRALRNRFIDKYERRAIVGFPQVAGMTATIQAAAVQRGDPHGAALWAGAAFRHAKTGPAADIVRELAA